MKQIIVTVGREHGSGGKYIAEQIAKQLGIAFYDKELLLDSVFNAEDAARYDEKPVHLLWSRRIGENFNAPEDALAHETFDYIQKLADSGESFVVLGRLLGLHPAQQSERRAPVHRRQARPEASAAHGGKIPHGRSGGAGNTPH